MLAECDACRQRMTIGEQHLGQQFSCPGCGSLVQIPEVVPALVLTAAATAPAAHAVVQHAGGGGGGALVHRCPRCGSDVEHGNNLCPRCGVNIKRAKRRH